MKKKLTKTFSCDCGGHLIKFEYNSATKKFPFSLLSIQIYNTLGKYRKLKNPKLEADVVIVNGQYPKELKKLGVFFQKLSSKIAKDTVFESWYRTKESKK